MTTKPYNGWEIIDTIQSKEILTELSDAKKYRRAKLLIAETGNSKSFTSHLFKQKKDKNTFVITVGDSYKIADVADAMLDALCFTNFPSSIRLKIALIVKKLKELSEESEGIVFIIDEAENLKPSTLRMMKELYDAIIDYCSMVLIGTEQILDTIFNKRKRNRQGVPQLWRRFKAGKREITPLNKARDYKAFYDKYIPGELDLQDLITGIAENYGELHDYLHPFLQHCSATGEPITEKTFRLFHKIPKQAPLRKVS